MKKYFILILLISQCLFSQHNVKFQEPKSPEITNIERYGNTGISEYNGRINFSIPLYTINYGDLTLPLSINYNSNGIRVDEESSEIGLGWQMNINATVTQTINGKNDLNTNLVFQKLDYYSTPYPQAVLIPNPYWVNHTIPTYSDPSDPDRIALQSSFPDLNKFSMLKLQDNAHWTTAVYFPRNNNELINIEGALRPGTNYDFELDYFTANFFGHNISFYKEPGSNIFKVIDNSKYKIYCLDEIQQGLSRKVWKIIAPEGVEYFFNEIKSNSTSSMGLVTTMNPTNSYGYCLDNSCDSFESSSMIWKISKIKDTKGNEIVFQYENLPTLKTRSANSGMTDFYNITSNVNNSIAFACSDYMLYQGPINSTYQDVEYLYSGKGAQNYCNASYVNSGRSIIKEIIFGDDRITFTNATRNDLPSGSKRIESMLVKHNSLNVHSITFNNNHFTGSSYIDSRMILDGLTINNKLYGFDYYLENPLPPKNSNSLDYWGFYNGIANTTITNNPLRLYKNHSDIPVWARSFITTLDSKANRSAHPVYCKTGMLKQIQYPTGGKTVIEYELNEFDNYFFPNYDNKVGIGINNTFSSDYVQNVSQGYGLRILKTTDYFDQNNYLIRKYSYSGGKHIPAYVWGYQGWHDSFHLDGPVNPSGGCPSMRHSYGEKISSYYSNSYQSNDMLGNGDAVGYDMVTIEEISPLNNKNGKTVRYYTNVPDVSARQKFGYTGQPLKWYDDFGYSIRNTDIDNGNLTKEEFYNQSNNLVQEKTYSYNSIILRNSMPYNVKKGYIGKYYNGVSGIYNEHLLYYYPLKQTKTLLTGIITKDYLGSNPIINNESFSFDNNYLQNGKSITSPNVNYSESTSMLNTSFAQSKNILNIPYQTIINQNGSNKLTKEYEYLEVANTLQLGKVHILPDGNPNPAKKITTFYDLYDDRHNVTQFHKAGDIYTSIVWGYNKTLPVAKIENLQYTQIQASIITAIQQASDSGDETQLLNQLNNLRNSMSSFPNATITTYTHKPLIGISTIIDIKGDKKTFEYDSSQQLKYVRDKDGNIISENEYHYRP